VQKSKKKSKVVVKVEKSEVDVKVKVKVEPEIYKHVMHDHDYCVHSQRSVVNQINEDSMLQACCIGCSRADHVVSSK